MERQKDKIPMGEIDPIDLLSFHIKELGYITEANTWPGGLVVRYVDPRYRDKCSESIQISHSTRRVRFWVEDNLDIYYISLSKLQSKEFSRQLLCNLYAPDSISKIEEVIEYECHE